MNARIPSIDVSPEACSARRNSTEAMTVARRLRDAELELAREIYRRHGIRDDAELLQSLQNIAANCADSAWQERVMEVILDLDADMNTPEPELSGFNKVGELDSGTAGVRHRSAA
jgi:hypothetical protein